MSPHPDVPFPVTPPAAVPQRVITVSLIGNDTEVIDYYSFWSPVSGVTYTNVRQCVMEDDQAINTLFVLDYFSTQNGWTMKGITPVPGWPFFPETTSIVPGALGQSIMTHDMHLMMQTYRYAINYVNSVTGVTVPLDPQQGNIPKTQPL